MSALDRLIDLQSYIDIQISEACEEEFLDNIAEMYFMEGISSAIHSVMDRAINYVQSRPSPELFLKKDPGLIQSAILDIRETLKKQNEILSKFSGKQSENNNIMDGII